MSTSDDSVGDDFGSPEVERICAIISRQGFKRVVLQFPDELLGRCVDVFNHFRLLVPTASFYIAADSTYGSSVDDVSALHVDSDLLVYFGSDLSSSGKF